MASVLFVCTGNICRSPTADGVLQKLLSDAGLGRKVAVDSAGTHGWHVGDPPDHRAIACAAARGYDLSALRARKFTHQDYRDFDVIAAMDQGHYDHLLAACPDDLTNRVRLFLDFAEPSNPNSPLRSQDVPDPYYGGLRDFEHMLDLIERGAAGMIEDLKQNHL